MTTRETRRRMTLSAHTVRHTDQGFTILETAVAMLVMMIAVLGAVSIFAYSIGNNAGAKDRELAMGVAQQQVEQFRNLPFTNANLNATGTAGRTATITNAGRRFTVVTTITDSNTINGQPTLKTIRIRVTPVGGPMGSVTLETRRATVLVGPNR